MCIEIEESQQHQTLSSNMRVELGDFQVKAFLTARGLG